MAIAFVYIVKFGQFPLHLKIFMDQNYLLKIQKISNFQKIEKWNLTIMKRGFDLFKTKAFTINQYLERFEIIEIFSKNHFDFCRFC